MKASNRALLCIFLFLFCLAPVMAGSQDEGNGQDAVEDTVEVDQDAADDESGEVDDAVETAEAIEGEEAPIEPMVEEILDVSAEDIEVAAPETGDEAIAEGGGDAGLETDTDTEAGDATAPAAPESFILQGHPIFTPDQAELVYRPLVNYLNEATPYRFDLQISRDFHRYWLDVRRGETPDLVLEEAHLTAFRMQRDGYTPLVKAVEPMTYSLMASPTHVDGSLRDFVGQPVSSMPSPSLGYLVLSRWYENPMQQPIIQSNASSWLDAIEIVFSMEAEAAIAPRNLADRYVNLEMIETSQEFPGLTLSASPAVPEEIQREIRAALLVLHEDDQHYAAVHELDIEQFVEADPAEYEGLEEWLREVTGSF